ncbi:urease accessory protein UreD [Epibacterium ulvae]|uniref:urease accessory protein UreD n=1 Tax=Epibacterium ulvae TaxID=1156985 RepID=UPI0024933C20|nr:urease accessory protein UreD [Epibacterium ulvae]
MAVRDWEIYDIFTLAEKTEASVSEEIPRTKGTLFLSTKQVAQRSGLDGFRTSGAMKALFPRTEEVQAILINTSGGLTGGDQLDIEACAGTNSALSLTTQAAERAYRAQSGVARVTTNLRVQSGAELNWLPQELILFQGAALQRSLAIQLEEDARVLMIEPVVFGRTAMGETITELSFRDRVSITRAGRPVYRDGLDMTGDATAQLARRAVAQGAKAMASLVYIAPDAEAHLPVLRQMLNDTSGVSLKSADLLVGRLLASDSFELRKMLLPILDRLSSDRLPTSWRL